MKLVLQIAGGIILAPILLVAIVAALGSLLMLDPTVLLTLIGVVAAGIIAQRVIYARAR